VVSFGKYTGALWTKEGETLGRTCLLESNRMRVDHHIRRLPSGESINDWLWVDYGDRVNVLVQERGTNKFVVLEQTKYALEGSSLATVGGFIEPDELPTHAAAREVEEELGLRCPLVRLQTLGKYRTDVNRGLGWVHAFLAQGCVSTSVSSSSSSTSSSSSGNSAVVPVPGVADADSKQEVQEQRRLSREEVEAAVMAGRFVEVQWSNTVSLAMLYLRTQQA
jgi:ADP-ribose pyrophosphatase YjhB (NUDIX family)